MPFAKLRDRIDNLPLVLAGPIVRRVEPSAVSVWVALRRRRRVRLSVFDGHPLSGQRVAHGESETVAIGANLHIICVTAAATAPLSAGKTYQYELFFDHLGATDDIPAGTLVSPQIVAATEAEARTALTYGAHNGPAWPSFVLPPTNLSELRLLHGSCRKESGDHSDALEAADHILRSEFVGNGKRPHMLFLTGDNIYNDGCSIESFDVVVDAAPVLLGWDEAMPVSSGGGTTVSVKLSEMAGPRWAYCLDEVGLSSFGPALRHLFGLGETLTLHLLAFSPTLWPNDLDYQRKTFQFRGTLPAVRRALANIATYMIFDDHEFSNSWNLTADWVESVLDKPMGRRVYQNSLTAYALCQAWGNTPDRFATGAGKALLRAVADWSAAEVAGTASPGQPLAQIATALGIPGQDAFHSTRDWSAFHGTDVMRWDYTVPCPGLNIDVLDAYMWRRYQSKFANPVLISERGLDHQVDQANHANVECSLYVVSNVAIDLPGKGGDISTMRFIGWGLLSIVAWALFPLSMLLSMISKFAGKGPFPRLSSLVTAWRIYAPEFGASFEHQTLGFELLMARAAHRIPQTIGGKRQARVVFLSGDVHRSNCMRMEYWSRVPFGTSAAPVEGVMAQLISSPCKWVNPQMISLPDTDEHHWAGWRDKPNLVWQSEPDDSPWRFNDSPWMTEYTPAAKQPIMQPEPEWRYSLKPIGPTTPAGHQPLDIPDRPAPTLAEAIEEAKQIQTSLLLSLEKAHVLKVNNIGDVSFNWTPGSRTVVHEVWWRARPAHDREWKVSRFVVSMEPPPAAPALPK